MRISDWSSDVCSSDLHRQRNHFLVIQFGGRATDIPGVPQEHFRPLPSFLSSQNVIREPHKRGSQRHIFRIRVTLGWVGYCVRMLRNCVGVTPKNERKSRAKWLWSG